MKTTLKYMEKKKIYQNSTGTVTFDPKTLSAFSYSWWQFVKKYKGDVYFNNFRYSVTTQAHQRAVMDKLKEMNIRPIVVTIRGGLQDIEGKEIRDFCALWDVGHAIHSG